jgi:hypothetical protein
VASLSLYTASFIPAHFLRLLARASRRHNSTLSSVFIPGHTNTLSDLLSRSFHLSDDVLLAAVQKLAPLQQPWRLVTPMGAEASMVNSLLLKTRRDEEYLFLEQPVMIPHGVPGRSSASPYPKTLGLAHSKTPCPYFKYLPTDTASAKWLPPALQSRLERWRRPFVPWVRRLPHWDNVTRGSRHQADWTSDSTATPSLHKSRSPAYTSKTHPFTGPTTGGDSMLPNTTPRGPRCRPHAYTRLLLSPSPRRICPH